MSEQVQNPLRIAVVGAGITGLAAAYHVSKLARASGRAVALTLIESEPRLGGKIVTDAERGFTIEGGPDSFVTDKPWGLELCHELGLGGDLIPSNQKERKIYVLRKGRLISFPGGFRLTIPTEILPFLATPLISWPGKLRMGLDLFIPPRKDTSDESLGDFIRRRLGQEALDRFAGPLMAGIYVSDPDRMSMQSTFPRFADMERKYGSLIRGARAAKKIPPPPRKGPAPAGGAMFNSLKGGMASLVTALDARIEAERRTGTRVTAVERRGHGLALTLEGTHGGTLEVDHALFTSPAYVTAELIAPLHAELAQDLRGIPYVTTSTVSVGFRKADLPASRPLDGYGFMIPHDEKSDALAVTWSSTKFGHRAPEDHVLMRVFVGGHRSEDKAKLPDAELLAVVRHELNRTMGITATPVLHRIYRWPRGNPQYLVGHLDRIAQMEKKAATIPGLHLAGSAFRGIGMPDCIWSGRQAAEAMVGTAQR